MARQESIETLVRRSVGKDAGDALLAKIDAMVARRATPAAIQKAVAADLEKEFARQVVSAVVSGIGPVKPVQARTIQAKVTPVVRKVIARSPIVIARSGIVQAKPGHRGGRTSKSAR